MKHLLTGASVAAITLFAMPSMAAVSLTTQAGLPSGPFLADFRGPDGGDTGSASLSLNGVLVSSAGGNIAENGIDGLGVQGNQENNEIDIDNNNGPAESLTFVLPQGVNSVAWGITDLFATLDGDANPEEGSVTVSGAGATDTFTFTGVGDESGNGEVALMFSNLAGADTFEFFVANDAPPNSDFSVGLVTPLPAAVWMFGAGLAAVSGAAYRRRRAGATPAT